MKQEIILRQDALSIFYRAVQAVDPIAVVRNTVKLLGNRLEIQGRSYNLASFQRVYIVGAGKAAAKMAQAIEELLGERVTSGVVNVKYGHGVPLKTVRIYEAGHPIPDREGLKGTAQIVKLLSQTTESDLVICLISGGGSALLPCPVGGLTLKELKQVTRLLLRCGASIHEMNAVRKHLSRIKGGRMAQLAHPSSVVSLILSDVVGDDLGTIASGPMVPDSSRFGDCLKILDKYRLRSKMPRGVSLFLENGERGELEETPKSDDPIFTNTYNVIVGNNQMALEAARNKAKELGYHTMILSGDLQGETQRVARDHGAIAKQILNTGKPISRPACVISGGETTVTVKGKGLGGRNQEFALAAAIDIEGLGPVAILSGGTDGTDGPTDAAGAIVDGATIERAQGSRLNAHEFLRKNDSYHFFQALDDLLITGPTYTNVMDLRLVLVA